MRRPLVNPSDGFTRPSNTLVREWHRLACSASGTSWRAVTESLARGLEER